MARWPFLEFCGRFLEFKQKHEDTWIGIAENFFQEEAQRKWKRYPAFSKKIKRFFIQAPAFQENGIEGGSKPSVDSLFLEDFFPLLREWISLVTSMTPSNITLEAARIVYKQEVLYKCHFFIPAEVLKRLDLARLDLSVLAGKMSERDLVLTVFLKLVQSLNFLFTTVASNDWQLVQISNLLEIQFDGMHVRFLVSFNGYKSKKLPIAYFRGNLIHFLQDSLCIKLDQFMQERLSRDNEDYLALARDAFFRMRDDLLGVIKHFQAKALLTNQISHFYEILAMIISRLDLGVKNVQRLLQEFADEHSMGEHETMLWSYLLDLVVRQAMLYETFQSNLVGMKGNESIVFMIVLQYYLVDFTRETLAEKLFLGEKLHDKLQALIESEPGAEIDHFHNFCNDFQHFLVNHFKIQDMDGYGVFIKGIFGRPLNRLLSRLFTSFLKSSHEQVLHNLEKLNSDPEMKRKVSFEQLVDFLDEFLEFCMKRVFFQPDLDAASRQFKDPSNRFSPTNIATGLFELLLYRELPFHENQWMETLAIRFRNQVDVIDVLDVKNELQSIPSDVLVNYVIHDAALKPTTILLHERLFDDIIKPFHEFNHLVRDFIQNYDNSPSDLETSVERFLKDQVPSMGKDLAIVKKLGKIFLTLMASRFSQS
ncbi:MAG TPA: hypothetical protein VKM55_06925 [Candidatus Lokiarchaeia archaeon]|nr:hypothetical protein [Candidatus Lokiarchaeia archaeon]